MRVIRTNAKLGEELKRHYRQAASVTVGGFIDSVNEPKNALRGRWRN